MPNDLIENRTFILDGIESFYGDVFQNCRLVLTQQGRPKFLNCVFIGCEFEPPLPDDGRGSWFDMMCGSVIQFKAATD